MNVFGIGGLELLVILLVAFVALGPGKTIEVARTIGRVVREARSTFADIMDAASLSDDDVGGRRNQANPRSDTSAPAQAPSDPIPMPSHLQETPDPPSSQPDEPDPASSSAPR